MVNPLPPVPIQAPETMPTTTGLYSVATVDTRGDSRHLGGVNLLPTNEGPSGRYEPDCPDPVDEHEGVRTPWEGEVFPPVTVWAPATLGVLAETNEEAHNRARHLLGLKEPVEAEGHAAEVLLARGDAFTPGGDGRKERIVEAVAEIEARFAAEGLPAVIHAPARFAAYVAEARMMVKAGSNGWATHLGSRWVFGGGYEALGGRLVGTGPVMVTRNESRIYTGLDVQKNERLVIAHRDLVVSWEGDPVVANIEMEEGQ